MANELIYKENDNPVERSTKAINLLNRFAEMYEKENEKNNPCSENQNKLLALMSDTLRLIQFIEKDKSPTPTKREKSLACKIAEKALGGLAIRAAWDFIG